MIPLTLVTGASGGAREAAIAALVAGAPDGAAVILEGLPDGRSAPLAFLPAQLVQRIAPGCLCCTGNLVLRVTLHRLLRAKPARLFIGLADPGHIAQLRQSLSQAPYDALLQLTEDLAA